MKDRVRESSYTEHDWSTDLQKIHRNLLTTELEFSKRKLWRTFEWLEISDQKSSPITLDCYVSRANADIYQDRNAARVKRQH